MLFDFPLLSLVVWLPVLGGIGVLVLGDSEEGYFAKRAALGVSVVTFIASLWLYKDFNLTTAAMQFEENVGWIDAFKIRYHLGIDGVSLPLVLLTTLITPLVILTG